MKPIQIITKLSYLTSHHYVAWILSNILFFLPLVMILMLIKAIEAGLKAGVDLMVENDFKINFSYCTYQNAKQVIARNYMKNCVGKT